MKTIGAKLVMLIPGEVHIEYPYAESLTQQHGYIHAGIVTTVVDSACGYAAYTLMPAESEVLTVEYKVNFMSPAKGDGFKGIGRVLRAGRNITVCSGDVIGPGPCATRREEMVKEFMALGARYDRRHRALAPGRER